MLSTIGKMALGSLRRDGQDNSLSFHRCNMLAYLAHAEVCTICSEHDESPRCEHGLTLHLTAEQSFKGSEEEHARNKWQQRKHP